jgi:uncharacterized protein (DUF2141 family)
MRAPHVLVACAVMTLAAPGDGARAVAPTPHGGALTVNLEGVRGGAGVILVEVFGGQDQWLHRGKALVHARTAPTAVGVVTLENVPPGPVAVAVLHDENQNNKLDMRWLPWPRPAEGAGASRNPRPRWGPPAFGDAVFVFTPPQTVTITLYYPD